MAFAAVILTFHRVSVKPAEQFSQSKIMIRIGEQGKEPGGNNLPLCCFYLFESFGHPPRCKTSGSPVE